MDMTSWFIPRIKSLEKSTIQLNEQIEALDQTYIDLTDRLDTMDTEISNLEEMKHELDDDIEHIIQQTLKKHLQIAFGINIPDDRKK
jgi:chromosome segregation ATPase